MSEGQKAGLAILAAYALGMAFMVGFVSALRAILEALT